jgi:hypothetical protein
VHFLASCKTCLTMTYLTPTATRQPRAPNGVLSPILQRAGSAMQLPVTSIQGNRLRGRLLIRSVTTHEIGSSLMTSWPLPCSMSGGSHWRRDVRSTTRRPRSQSYFA